MLISVQKNKAELALFLRAHNGGSGEINDPEPIPLPIASQKQRAQANHIAWERIRNGGSPIKDETVPIKNFMATQDEIDKKRVAKHKKEWEKKGKYDETPIGVQIGKKIFILDGHHRICGAMMAGATSIDTTVIDGNEGKDADKAMIYEEIITDLSTKIGVKKAMGAPTQMLVGITGHSGSHKTCAAKHLCRVHGFDRIHAGDPVKRAMRAGMGMSKKQTNGKMKDKASAKLGGASPREVMEPISSALHRASPNLTSTLMRRRVIKRLLHGKHVVVEGIRSQKEADMIKSMGGKILRMDNQEGTDPKKPMDQKQKPIDSDYTIDSSKGKKEIREACDGMLKTLFGSNPMARP